jgi:hypothetical protein
MDIIIIEIAICCVVAVVLIYPLLLYKRLNLEDSFIAVCVLSFLLFLFSSELFLDSMLLFVVGIFFVGLFVYLDTYEHSEEHEHQRILAAKRRQQEQMEADRAVLNAEQGITNQRDQRGIYEERWRAKAEAARDKVRVDAAVVREALKEDTEENTTKASDETWWVDKQLAVLYEKERQAKASGEDPTPYREAIEGLERLNAAKDK